MALMQKANRVVDVDEHKMKYYLEQGYSLVDEYGNIIEEAVPNDIGILKIKYKEFQNTIKEQAAEIDRLNEIINSKRKRS